MTIPGNARQCQMLIGPTIALAMGERGLISRLLAPKYGGYLTFGSLSSGKESAPGQPTIAQLRDLFRLPCQQRDTKVIMRCSANHLPGKAAQSLDLLSALALYAAYVPVLMLACVVTLHRHTAHNSLWLVYRGGSVPGMLMRCCLLSIQVYGIVGNPVGHSRSPLLHNAGFHSVGYNAVYVPLLIDSLEGFLAHPLSDDFTGLSVTIPHKVLEAQRIISNSGSHCSCSFTAFLETFV